MTDLIKELEAALEKATPLPWGNHPGETALWWHDEIEVCSFESMDDRASNASNLKLVKTAVNAMPRIIEALKDPESLENCLERMADSAEMLWIVLANVSGGDWDKQTDEWKDAAIR